MGPDLELKGRLGSMASLDGKETEKCLGEPVDKTMCCISNYQDDILELEASVLKQADQVIQVAKAKVRITESTHQSQNPLDESASQDETENSSSFGNTMSGDENDDILSDSEVMSKLSENELDQECRMRKKGLTSHWKTFIQPYMWRCRWAELNIRQLLYQASKYDLQAEAISRRQQLASKNSTVEDTGAKSLPFSGSMQKGALFQRKKRKRAEDSIDTAAYMAQHPLFSYRGRKKCGADVVSSLNDRSKLGIPMKNRVEGNSVFGCGDKPVSLEFRNDDNSLEQILWKIGVLQSHLGELKTRFRKVHDENGKYIYSAAAMNSNDVSTNSAQNDVSSNEREKLVQVSTVASQLVPKCNSCDKQMTGSAFLTHGEDTNLIESGEKEGDGHLMCSSTATELNNTKKVDIQPTEKPETQKQEEQVEIQSTEKPETQKQEEQVEIQSMEKPETPKQEEQVEFHPAEKPETPKKEEQVEIQSTEKPGTPNEEEQANIVPLVPVTVLSISDGQHETPKEEQANRSSSVQVISTADDEPTPKKRSISELTSPHNTRNRGRGRGRGRGRRRGYRWSRRA